jgi:hypothetical protein
MGGTRGGRIVLVRRKSIQEPGRYTIKIYHRVKTRNGDN